MESETVLLPEKLRSTTEQMACRASVDQATWQDHSTACLNAADAIERLTRERDVLRAEVESAKRINAEQHALLQQIAEQASAAEAALATARECLEFFADDDNWRLNGKCDPNSGNFIGTIHARAALAELPIPEIKP